MHSNRRDMWTVVGPDATAGQDTASGARRGQRGAAHFFHSRHLQPARQHRQAVTRLDEWRSVAVLSARGRPEMGRVCHYTYRCRTRSRPNMEQGNCRHQSEAAQAVRSTAERAWKQAVEEAKEVVMAYAMKSQIRPQHQLDGLREQPHCIRCSHSNDHSSIGFLHHQINSILTVALSDRRVDRH